MSAHSITKRAFFEGIKNLVSGPQGPSKFQAYKEIPKANKPSVLTPDVVHPGVRRQVESGTYKPAIQDSSLGDRFVGPPTKPGRASYLHELDAPATPSINDAMLSQFRKGTASTYDPNSRVDRAKMDALLNGSKDWAIRKSAFIKLAAYADPEYHDYRKKKDSSALRNRHIALALKRALQGGAVGAFANVMGNIGSGEENSAGKGAILGALLGGGVGALEGATKRSLGLDPMLDTTLVAHRA